MFTGVAHYADSKGSLSEFQKRVTVDILILQQLTDE